MTEGWPAFGLYVDDSTCTMPSLMAAFSPNCNSYVYEENSISTDLTCTDTSGVSFSIYGLNSSIPYDECSGEPSVDLTMVADQCTSFAMLLPTVQPYMTNILEGSMKDIFGLLQVGVGDNLYYYADCGGGENIPGIETNSNSGHDNNSGDNISAGVLNFLLSVLF